MNDQQILEIFAKLCSPSYYGKGKNYMRLKWAMSAALTNPLFNELQDAGIRIQRIDNTRASGVNIWLPLAWYESIKRSSGGKIKWMKFDFKPKQEPHCPVADTASVRHHLEMIAYAYSERIYKTCRKSLKKSLAELRMITGSSDELDGKLGLQIVKMIESNLRARELEKQTRKAYA